jgi:hypothetical protein
MTDESIAARIERLVAEEHELRTREQAERDDNDALGADPEDASTRDANTVERSLQ